MKKLTAALLAALLLAAAVPAPASAGFSDVTDAATLENVEALKMLGIVNGVGGGLYNPSGTLTRAEFCKLAVCAMHAETEASQYASITIFPDVRGGYWASGYVNYCVKKGIILGTGDGKFTPERTIRYSEAVTILMRLLGYADADFTALWPYGYLSGAKSIGLSDSLGLNAGDTLTRAQAAQLFKNLLVTFPKGGADTYISTVYTGTVDDAIIVALDSGTVTAYTGALTVYDDVAGIPSDFIGKSCILVLNGRGDVTAAVPYAGKYTVKKVTVSAAEYTYVSDSSGTKHYLNADADAYYGGKLSAYSEVWLKLKSGSDAYLYYDGGGVCKFAAFSLGAFKAASAVILDAAPATANMLAARFGLSSGSYKIVKNGDTADASALAKYDAVTYDASTKTFYASDFKLTGYYEAAYPNPVTPTKLTLMGTQFDVLPQARDALAAYPVGSKLTLVFTSGLDVAAVYSAASLKAENVGFIKSSDGSTATVELLNGLEVSGRLSSSANVSKTLVSVTSSAAGSLSLSLLKPVKPGANFSVDSLKLGSAELSSGCRIFDCINAKSGAECVTEVELDDITVSTVKSSDVLHASYDSSGRVTLLLLGDVTGECYDYGLLRYGTVEKNVGGGGMTLTETVKTLGVRNSPSDPTGYEYDYAAASMNNRYGGIAVSGKGIVRAHVLLGEVSAKRADFTDGYVTAGALTIPLSDNLVVYNKDTGSWGTKLGEALAYSSELTVYYDDLPSNGGKVRIVVAG